MRASTRFCLKVFITLFSYRSLALSAFNSKALIYLSLAGFTLVSPDSLASSLLLLLSLSSRSFFSNVSFSLSYPANIEGRGSSSISFFLPDVRNQVKSEAEGEIRRLNERVQEFEKTNNEEAKEWQRRSEDWATENGPIFNP